MFISNRSMNMEVKLWDITSVLVAYICFQIASCTDPSVITKDTTFIGEYGKVDFRGTTRSFKLFKGIPYAQPPVGSLRFKKPVSLETPLPSPYLATKYGNGCLQPLFEEEYRIFAPRKQSEDCLYLNVFVPEEKPDKDTGHAVMVYIHTGGYVMGSGEVGGEYLASYGNVIVVSINYRLGVFGFLGTGDENGPGNLGLWDQHAALRWVHDNIAAFGGDDERVTIFGESAGAISAMFQALYPPNKGLFQRVIAESGTPGMQFLFLYDPKVSLKSYADLVDCKAETPKQQINCLRDTPADKIAESIQRINTEQSFLDTRVFPYMDNDFITIDPLKISEIIQDNEAVAFYRSLDIVNGINSHEGLSVYDPKYLPVVDNKDTFKPSRQTMDGEAVPMVAEMFHGPLGEPLLRMVSAQYTDWSDPDSPVLLRDQLVKLIGDLMMAVPSAEYSRLHVNTTDVSNSYVYLFSPTPSNPLLPLPSWTRGANHGEDLGFVFFFHCLDERLPSNDLDYQLSYDIMTYWSNFAKSGSPNEPVPVKVEWPKYDMKDQSYLVLDNEMSNEYRKKHFYAREVDFWLNIIPSLKEALNPPEDRSTPPHGSCSADGECP